MLLTQVADQVTEAAIRIKDKGLYKTALQRATWLEVTDGSTVFLKLESEQVTGSFKARGAMNKITSLTEAERCKGVVTASTGNHALATTFASKFLQSQHPEFKYRIFLPTNASSAKVDHLKALGAPLTFFGDDCLETEIEAREEAKRTDAVYISPYNDMSVLAGQGTVAMEILEQLPQGISLDAIFVPVGGGGLISGISGYIKKHSPSTLVYGCSASNDAHLGRSIGHGAFITGIDYLENGGITLSEGTAGAVENGSITFDICRETVDVWLEVSEEEIGRAVVDMLDKHHKAVEGAAGLGIAGYRKVASSLAGKNVAIVVCGGNVKARMMKDLLTTYLN